MDATKTVRAYCVQQDGHEDWFDVTEWMTYRATAEAALARFREDCPHKSYRLADADVPPHFLTRKPVRWDAKTP
jgi:hypothetical protein